MDGSSGKSSSGLPISARAMGQHLLLTPGEGAGELFAPMFEDRKQFIDRVNLFIDFGPAAAFMVEIGAQMNIVQDPQMREQLSTQVRLTTTMNRKDNKAVHIRKSSKAEPSRQAIYDALNLSYQPGRIVKTVLYEF